MTKEEKIAVVEELSEKLINSPFFYITDASSMTVAQVTKFRKICFDNGIECTVVKNSLIKKALEKLPTDYTPFHKTVLKGFSAVLISPESGKAPAKILMDFRKANKMQKPVLKGASIDSSLYIGDETLEKLSQIKSKEEVVGDIVMLLQSPARRVVGAITSGGGRVAGAIKTIADKA